MFQLTINLDKYEKIATGKRGDYLVKCPVLDELKEAIKGEKNRKFLSVSMDANKLRELSQDDKHIYVNILPDTKELGPCAGQARIMVPGSDDFHQFYAVEVKPCTGK